MSVYYNINRSRERACSDNNNIYYAITNIIMTPTYLESKHSTYHPLIVCVCN